MASLRTPCSKEERLALQEAAARLGGAGYDVSTEEFVARPTAAPWLATYAALAAVAALLVYPAPLFAALAGAAAVVLHARDSEGRPLLRRWTRTSHNVVARSRRAETPRLVVLTHADSGPAPRGRGLVVGLHALMASVPAAGGAAWVAEAGTVLPPAIGIAGAVIAAGIAGVASLLYGRRGSPPPGEAALDVLAGLAETLRSEPVWVVVTGARAAGSLGIQAFLAAHGHDAAGAAWLNLEPGTGPAVVAVSEEGTWRERRADRLLMGAAEEAGAEVRPQRAAPTDATVLLARRRRALTLTVPPGGADAAPIALAVAAVALQPRG